MVDMKNGPLIVRVILITCFIAFFTAQPSCTDSEADSELPTPAICVD